MLSLDRLSLAVPSWLITDWRIEDRVYDSRYTDLPYHLLIKHDGRFRNYKVEFSAKILRDRYPELITADNVVDCLNIINTLGICTLDVDGILREGKVIGADFTKDVPLTVFPNIEDMRKLKTVLKLAINNHDRWNCANYRSGGMVISNAVNDCRWRRRLTVYDKADELRLSTNRPFLASLEDSERLMEYFRGRVRFELRATTQFQLRKWLGIRELGVMDVLRSTENPLRRVMSEMFSPLFHIEESNIKKKNLTTLGRLSTLKYNNWNLDAVEVVVRQHSKRSIRESMKPYKELWMADQLKETVDIVEAVNG